MNYNKEQNKFYTLVVLNILDKIRSEGLNQIRSKKIILQAGDEMVIFVKDKVNKFNFAYFDIYSIIDDGKKDGKFELIFNDGRVRQFSNLYYTYEIIKR